MNNNNDNDTIDNDDRRVYHYTADGDESDPSKMLGMMLLISALITLPMLIWLIGVLLD